MKNSDVLLEVLDFLKQQKLVESESEFSITWLGQCESYYRGLRHKKTEPTLGVVAICGHRLQKAGEQLKSAPEHANISKRFLDLSEQCYELVNKDAVDVVAALDG